MRYVVNWYFKVIIVIVILNTLIEVNNEFNDFRFKRFER